MQKKTVFITGSGRGIGRALALGYARSMYNIVACTKSEKGSSELIRELSSTSADYLVIPCDVRDKDSIRCSVLKAIERFGAIDIAILNAGIAESTSLASLDTDVVREVFDVNFFGVLDTIAQLLPLMKGQGQGTIACISSIADARPIPGASAYVSSKAALSTFLQAASIEAEKEGLRLINIRPGFVATDMTKSNSYPMPFLVSADQAAERIMKAIEGKTQLFSFPLRAHLLSTILRALPYSLWMSVFRRGILK